jgi:hypothetical protein
MTATCDGRHQLNSTLANQGPSKHDSANANNHRQAVDLGIGSKLPERAAFGHGQKL